MDASLPLGLRWAAASCQDVTSLVATHLNSKVVWLLNYIDDFRDVTPSREEAEEHFSELQAILDHLGLVEAKHKAAPPSQLMTWLGIDFKTVSMMITIPTGKLAEIADLITEWQGFSHTNLHTRRMVLGKLLNISQCCPPARFFLYRMLETLRAFPATGMTVLTQNFKKDLNCFAEFLHSTNGVLIINDDSREPVNLFIEGCSTGAGTVLAG